MWFNLNLQGNAIWNLADTVRTYFYKKKFNAKLLNRFNQISLFQITSYCHHGSVKMKVVCLHMLRPISQIEQIQ